MNFRQTTILFIIVALALIALLITTLFEDNKPRDGLIPEFTVNVEEKDVDTIEISRTDPTEGKLVFIRTESGWELRQPAASRIESPMIDAILRCLWRAKPTLYQGLTDNLAQHGLSSPTLKISLKSKGGRSVTVNLGDTTIGGLSSAVTFVSTSDRPDQPVAVRTAELRPIFRETEAGKDGKAAAYARWISDFRSLKLLSVDSAAIANVEKINLTQGPSTLALAGSEKGNWKFDTPANFGPADSDGDVDAKPDTYTGVRPLLNSLISLQCRSTADMIEGVEGKDLTKYGLSDSDAGKIRLEIQSRGAKPEVVTLGKVVEKDGKPVVPTQIYARKEGDSAVLIIQTDRMTALANLIREPSTIRSRDIMAESDKDNITAIDTAIGTETFRFRKIQGVWFLYGGAEPRYAHVNMVKSFIEQIARPKVALQVLKDEPAGAFAPQEIKCSVKLWIEPKSGKSSPETTTPPAPATIPAEVPLTIPASITLTLGKPESDGQLLRIDTADHPSRVFKVRTELSAAIVRRRVDYIDAKIGSFTKTLAERVTFPRGNETYELQLHKQPDSAYPRGRWDFVQPLANKGKASDSDRVAALLNLLSEIQILRVHSDNPTPEELKSWGLDPANPKYQVVVESTDTDNKKWVYQFGNETEDRQFVYLRVAGKPFVFRIIKSTLTDFLNADLRERLVFRTDPLMVNKIQLVGWKAQHQGQPLGVTLTKKDREWIADRAEFQVDPKKLQVFLNLLKYPLVTDFVDGAGLKPVEWGLTPANGSLTVTIWQEGVKDPIWLDISSIEESGKPGIFATSSGMPNVVFKLDSASFRSFPADPKSLTK